MEYSHGKKKISPSVKIKQVELYLEGKTSLHQIARKYGVAHSTVEIWVVKYKAEGRSGFYQEKRFKAYSKELKEQAVLEYLRGGVSLKTVCTKYAISSTTALRNWIKEYNTHGILKSNSGGRWMSKTRNTTQEERLEIVKYCILNGNAYGETAIKYSVSYQKVYKWVQRYKKLGIAGLEDRRGHNPGTVKPRTPEEELKAKVAMLEARNRDLQMENDLLKKLDELLRKERFR